MSRRSQSPTGFAAVAAERANGGTPPPDLKPDSKLLPKWRWLGRIVMDGPNLKGRAVATAFWLADYADKNSRAYPSRETLADLVGCSVRAIDTATASLSKRGWISAVGARPGPGQTRRWALNLQHAQILTRDSELSASAQQRAQLFAEHAKLAVETRADNGAEHAQKSANNPSDSSLLGYSAYESVPPSSENRPMAISSSPARSPEAFERRDTVAAAMKGTIWQGLPAEHQRRHIPEPIMDAAASRGRDLGIKYVIDYLEGREGGPAAAGVVPGNLNAPT